MTLATPSFAEFFGALHGYAPFPWQRRLAERVIEQGWPSTIDAPTGLGKTSVLDVALYVLAYQADLDPRVRTAHTRIALVVDRRLIVDSAFQHANDICRRLSAAESDVLRWARDRLRMVSGTDEALAVRQMRGGLTWDSLWATSPSQPLILTATVDQFGSRLLFRGYSTSDWIKPIDAGLLGSDCLVLVDEAHLSGALLETTAGVRAIEGLAVELPVDHRRLTVVSMTATPNSDSEPVLSDEDLADPVASARLSAVKEAMLIDVPGATTRSRAVADVGTALSCLAQHALTGTAQVVLVTANTVSAARAAFQDVRRAGIPAELVIGRCRPVDRDARMARWWPLTRTGRDRRAQRGPFVLVATQTVEVGVDLDVDALVTEVAPIDALIQRFGRVDRRGELGRTMSFIVRVPNRLRDDPPPYYSASAATWDWLSAEADVGILSGRTLAVPARRVDMGVVEVRNALSRSDQVRRLLAPTTRPPVVLPTAVSTWRRTSPIPVPDESIIGYLHGVGRGQPVVSVLWRCDLDLPQEVLVGDEVGVEPDPMPHEIVEVPLEMVRRWLAGEEESDSSDLDSDVVEPPSKGRLAGSLPSVVVRRGESWRRIRHPRQVRPGDILVVPSEFGGHDEFGFIGSYRRPVADVAELGGGSPFLRVSRPVLRCLLGRDLAADEAELVGDLRRAGMPPREARASAASLCMLMAERLDDASPYPDEVAALLGRFCVAGNIRVDLPLHGGEFDDGYAGGDQSANGVCVIRARTAAAANVSDDSDQSSTTAVHVSLESHLRSVGEKAAEFGKRCGLAPSFARAVELAGRLHDLGKAEIRFQALLAGGPVWMIEAMSGDSASLLAKSGRPLGRLRLAGQLAQWPRNMRHEALSLRMVAGAPDRLFAGCDRHLVEHLVAAHHGRARPLYQVIEDDEPTTARVDFDGCSFIASTSGASPGWDQPARFEQLSVRYGSWGLAYLEAIVRLADISTSKAGR